MKYRMLLLNIPVFSTFALSGLDSKVGPEMKSTGEGIAVASSMPEALSKVFHAQKAKHKTDVYKADSVELGNELMEATKKAGLSITTDQF